MEKELDSQKYVKLVNNVCAEAKQAAIDLLKECGDNCFIAIDEDDYCEAKSWDDVNISIFAVGLDEEGKLCVAATVDNIGYGNTEDDFDQGWTSMDNIYDDCYPELYRFIADNLDSATSKEEADKVIRNGDEDEDED